MKRFAVLLFVLPSFCYANPESAVLEEIQSFARRYIEHFERDTAPAANLPADFRRLLEIAEQDSRALVRSSAERAQREIIRRLQTFALNAQNRAHFRSITFYFGQIKTREAIEALALIAKTEHARNWDRSIYAQRILVKLAQEKDFVAVIDKCREILVGESANQGILNILSERWR